MAVSDEELITHLILGTVTKTMIYGRGFNALCRLLKQNIKLLNDFNITVQFYANQGKATRVDILGGSYAVSITPDEVSTSGLAE